MTTFDGWGADPGPPDDETRRRNWDAQMHHTPRNVQPAKRTGKTPEAKVSAAIDAYLKLIGCINIRANAGAWQDDAGNFIQGAKAGTSDKILCMPGSGKFIALECKSATGTQSEAQKKFQSRVVALGGLYILARSADDVRAALITAFGAQCVSDLETLGRARAAQIRKAKRSR